MLYEDEGIVAVDKPSGLTVVPARGQPAEESLAQALSRQRAERLFTVHRLDRETSGVVVFARSALAHRELSRAFEERRVEKEYIAFVAGHVEPAHGRIDVALHAARRGKSRPAAPGEAGRREAVSDYAVERVLHRAGATVSRLRVFPRSGRQHQIRVHLRWRGAPILFDRLYAPAPSPALAGAPCSRLALHAARLTLLRPSGQVAIESPLAPDLAALEAWLTQEAAP